MPKAKKRQHNIKPTLTAPDFCAQARRSIGGIRNKAAGGGAIYTYLGALLTILVPFAGCFVAGPIVCSYAQAALHGAATPKELFGSYKKDYKKFSLLLLINYTFTVLWGLLLIVPGVLKAMTYRMSYFLLAENPELTPWEAHKASVRLMKGHEQKLLLLMATFAGWAILSALTLGVLGCWLAPYREAAIAAFYEDLREEAAFRGAVETLQAKIDVDTHGSEAEDSTKPACDDSDKSEKDAKRPVLRAADFRKQARQRMGGIHNQYALGGAIYVYFAEALLYLLMGAYYVFFPFLDAILESSAAVVAFILMFAGIPIIMILVGFFVSGPLTGVYSECALRGGATPQNLRESLRKNYMRYTLLSFLNGFFAGLWGMLFVVPGIVKAMSYRLSYYILAEHPEYSLQDARRASIKLMMGHEWRLLRLVLSFAGWTILSVLTLGVLGCWVAPYRAAAMAAFYEDLRDEEELRNKRSSDVILEVRGLKKYFPIQTNLFGKPLRYLRAVDNVSMSVKTGTTIGVVGESGCGKTTLGRTILKLYESNGGTINFAGEDITNLTPKQMRKYRTDMQLIFQDPYSSLPPRMTVGAIISEGVRVHNIVPKDQVHEYVLGVMKQCGLQPQYYDRYPHEFSGGQRQRICIARALAVKPRLVICDEPVSALDVSIQAQIINQLKELQTSMGLTYVFISHDLSVVKYITNQIMVMYLGNVMEMGETEEIFDNPLHPYTKALFSAVPVPDPDAKAERIILEGDIPSPANPPSGCKFHTRCSQCMGICEFLEPAYVEAEGGHSVACHLYNPAAMAQREELEAEYGKLKSEREARIEHGRKQAIEAEERKEG